MYLLHIRFGLLTRQQTLHDILLSEYNSVMKNIFISGQIKEKYRIREVFAQLEAAGHQITHDWTRTDNMPKPYSLAPAEAGLRASKDIQGVLDADVYILMSDNRDSGKGMYVELGAALALATSQAKPIELYVVGPMNHESIFYYHPLVTHVETVEEVLRLIERSSNSQPEFVSAA